jgi:hypothetical protein
MSPFEGANDASPLTQGDIIDECPLLLLSPSAEATTVEVPPQRFTERVIVLTQACDLAQAKTARVVVAVIHPAESLVKMGFVKASAVRDQIRRNHVFGWYYLPEEIALRLPESLIDLRNLHTVPRAVLERLINAGKRVGRLITPFREHLAQHFAVTYMRIALPEAYETRP